MPAHNVHSRQPNDGGDEPELLHEDGSVVTCYECGDVIKVETDGTEGCDGDWFCLKKQCQWMNKMYNGCD